MLNSTLYLQLFGSYTMRFTEVNLLDLQILKFVFNNRLFYVLYNVRKSNIQGIYKRIVRFQKLTRNLFLNLHGHNSHF